MRAENNSQGSGTFSDRLSLSILLVATMASQSVLETEGNEEHGRGQNASPASANATGSVFLPSLGSQGLPPTTSVGLPLSGAGVDVNALQQALIAANATSILTNQNPLLQQQMLLQQQAAALVAAATTPLTHNLIPAHLQASALAASLNGTPGYSPAVIPPPVFSSIPRPLSTPSLITDFQSMTLQDRALLDPSFVPQFNGINPAYPGVRVLCSDPPIFAVDNFLQPLECQFLVTVASDSFGPAPVVGKGAGEVSASRTSSTCYLSREDLPDLMRKVTLLTGKPIEHCELPQVGRYLPSQQYLQHFDAFDTSNEDGRRFASNGGQRSVTVLVSVRRVSQTHSVPVLSKTHFFPDLSQRCNERRRHTVSCFEPAFGSPTTPRNGSRVLSRNH